MDKRELLNQLSTMTATKTRRIEASIELAKSLESYQMAGQ
jgi:hypothetical protein